MQRKLPKNREELASGFYKMYKAGRQWKEKLAAGEISNDEIWEMAYAKADEKIQERLDLLEIGKRKEYDWAQDDQVYREDRESQYREDYDWSIKSDEKILQNLLDVEVNIRQIKRTLQAAYLNAKDRDLLLERHSKLVSLHSNLIKDAGIDRVAREKRKSNVDPIEDWEKVKELARKKLDELEKEFALEAKKAQTEDDLRDRIKFHLAYPFNIVDAILKNHKRILKVDG